MRMNERTKRKGLGEEIPPEEKFETGYASGPLLTVGEAARYLGVSRKTLYQIIERGEITALKARGATLVEKKSLDVFRAAGTLT